MHNQKKLQSIRKSGFIAILTLSLPLLASQARAATISNDLSSEMIEMGCDIMVEGLIEDGDALKLEKAVIAQDKIIAEKEDLGFTDSLIGRRQRSHQRVCFHSPGGSFVEGLEIGKVLLKSRKGSAVGANMICESACALAFMGGSSAVAHVEGADDVDRVLHPLAKLGFHSPSIIVPNQVYEKETVEKAYNVAIKSIAEIVKAKNDLNISYIPGTDQRTSIRFDIPNSLLLFMLLTPPEKMAYVETVEQASRWGIRVEPINVTMMPEPKEALANVCDSQSYFWSEQIADFYERPPFVDGYKGLTAGFEVISAQGVEDWRMETRNGVRLISDMGEYWFNCDVEVFKNLKFSSIDNLSDPIGGATGTGARRYFYPFQLFSPNTMIADLVFKDIKYSEYLGSLSRLNSFVSYFSEKRVLSCALNAQTATVVNVSNFTNLRQQAGLAGRVINQIRLGETVKIVRPGTFLRYDRCAAACESSDQNAINACIDNNDVWIEVQYNGLRGFLSRKFLE